MSHTQHFLVSAYGSRWKEVNLAMFTIYVDDSGTDPNQKLAVASALIVPAIQIPRIDSLWQSFRKKEGFNYLHAAEIATRYRKEQFAGWDDAKARHVFHRARQITMKHSSAAYVFAIDKKTFDREAPPDWKGPGGENHYTWAFRTLLHQLINWHRNHNLTGPYEFVFDNATGKDRDEIEMLMSQFDLEYPGWLEGHYSFRCKANVPCLQAADILAWTSYSLGLSFFFGSPQNQFALESMQDFRAYREGEWLTYLTYDQTRFREVVAADISDSEGTRKRAEWHTKWKEEIKTRRRTRPRAEKCPC